ncbi:MAG: sulfatase [Paenibacillaceae bacterium]|nr:sulfatase [Paenibacillaceae bacterium]
MRIVYLDLDSTRPDHLGCYGYRRNTSPHIDRIAREGVLFTNYYTSDAPCFPSRTALTTGRFGIHNGVVGHGGTAGDPRIEGASRQFKDRCASDNLASVLKANGFRTALVSPFGERHSAWTFYAGYHEMYNTGKGGQESAEEVTPTALRWIEQNAKDDDWFLYVNYWDPHTPYRVPPEYDNPFQDEPLPEWLTEEVLERHQRKPGPHSALDMWMYSNVNDRNTLKYPRYPGELTDMDTLRQAIDGYDVGIRYMDEHIGQLFEAFRRQGVMDDLVVIISADHGENMGELGIYGEHGTADQATCRIPMIIRWPGLTSGTADHGLHYHLDLGPTLTDMLGIGAPASWDGSSYAGSIREGGDTGRDYLVVSQCAHVCQRSVRFRDYLYIRTYHDGYHLFPREMLFDVKRDPHEQRNLAAERRDLCMEAVYCLNEWHDRMMSTMPFDNDPLWTVMKEGGPFHAKGHLARYVKRLEETGRGDAVPELRSRHPREFA